MNGEKGQVLPTFGLTLLFNSILEKIMDVDEMCEENDVAEILEYLVENDELQGPALGIARQVIDKGRDSLSGKQVTVFAQQIEDKYLKINCSRCHIPIPIGEILVAIMEDDKLCSWCRKMVSNDD